MFLKKNKTKKIINMKIEKEHFDHIKMMTNNKITRKVKLK